MIDDNSELMDNLRLEDSNSTTHASVLSNNPLVDQSSFVVTAKVTNKFYEPEKIYPSLAAAMEGVKMQEVGGQSWTRGPKYSTKMGDKIIFTCQGFPKCPRRLKLFLDPEVSDVQCSVSTDTHDHLIKIGSKNPLDRRSKALVLELLSVGVKQPRKLLKELQKNNLPALSRAQVNNLKQRTQRKVSFIQILLRIIIK